jgi:hypothetical protein
MISDVLLLIRLWMVTAPIHAVDSQWPSKMPLASVIQYELNLRTSASTPLNSTLSNSIFLQPILVRDDVMALCCTEVATMTKGALIFETTSTNKHQQAPTSTNKHQQAPTSTNKHQQAPTSTNKHQQA